MTLGTPTAVGARPHTVTLQNPGPAVPDGDGGFTLSWTDLVPAQWTCRIAPATARDLERVTAGTVLSTATHVLTGPYRGDITTKTRAIFNGRTFSLTGVSDPEERHVETIAIGVEVVA